MEQTVYLCFFHQGTLQEWCWFFGITVVLMISLAVLIATCWKSELQPFARRATTAGEVGATGEAGDAEETGAT